MGRATTEALVLRRLPFGESSQIAEFLTRDAGRVSVIAKGVFRPRARKGGGLDLLDRCLLTWSQRRGSRSLPQLVERKVLDHHPGLRRREDLLRAGGWLVELLRGVAPEGQPVRGLFDLSVAYLEALDAVPPPAALPAIVFALQGGILRLAGFEPVLDRCVVCERRPQGHRLLRCDPGQGGIVCSGCRDGQGESFLLSTRAVQALQALAGRDPRGLGRIVLPPDLEGQMRHLHERILLHVLERPPRSAALAPVRP